MEAVPSICNLRLHHVMVTRTHINMVNINHTLTNEMDPQR